MARRGHGPKRRQTKGRQDNRVKEIKSWISKNIFPWVTNHGLKGLTSLASAIPMLGPLVDSIQDTINESAGVETRLGDYTEQIEKALNNLTNVEGNLLNKYISQMATITNIPLSPALKEAVTQYGANLKANYDKAQKQIAKAKAEGSKALNAATEDYNSLKGIAKASWSDASKELKERAKYAADKITTLSDDVEKTISNNNLGGK